MMGFEDRSLQFCMVLLDASLTLMVQVSQLKWKLHESSKLLES
jgi:hypothetical protein